MNASNGSQFGNLDGYSRFTRLIVAAALIASVMVPTDGYVGGMAVFPLLAIYVMFTTITGFDPLKAGFQAAIERVRRQGRGVLKTTEQTAS